MSGLYGFQPLIVVVGETASGKSALALHLAQRFDGEILCSDSRTVYQGTDIGTAKPSLLDQLNVSHFGLNLLPPSQAFTVANFKVYADGIIEDIISRGKVPIMVGGSGLYIDAVIYDYQFGPIADSKLRQELNMMTVQQLQEYLQVHGLGLPANNRNPRHLIRAIETNGQTAQRSALRPHTLLLGLQVERRELLQRISQRVETMIAAGLVDETKLLADQYGWEIEAMRSTSYQALKGYLEHTKSLDQAKADFIQNDMRLAKKQRSWFKRNKSIHWLASEDKLTEAVDYATTFLSK